MIGMRTRLPRRLSTLTARAFSSAVGPNLKRLRVGGVPEHFNTPWHMAAAAGRFEELGLAFEWKEYPGGTGAMCRDLRSDEIDLAVLLTEGIVADLHHSAHSRLLGTYVRTPLTWGVHVHASSSVHSMEQLRAPATLRYAVSRMGSGSHLMAAVDARARGWDPSSLHYEVVGSLQGARSALAEGKADAFMWEKFTTKPLVDSGEWRRVGEVDTPWPCFMIAATNDVLERMGPELLEVLRVVREEAEALELSPDAAEVIGTMYGLEDADVSEWLTGMRWSCQPAVSHTTLEQVMATLGEVGVLDPSKLLPPSSLVSGLAADVEPETLALDDEF